MELKPPPRKKLVGWPRIARHFDVDERTVRRWEAQAIDPLPVFNDSENKQCVAAFDDDLDAWRRRQPGNTRRKSRVPRERVAA